MGLFSRIFVAKDRSFDFNFRRGWCRRRRRATFRLGSFQLNLNEKFARLKLFIPFIHQDGNCAGSTLRREPALDIFIARRCLSLALSLCLSVFLYTTLALTVDLPLTSSFLFGIRSSRELLLARKLDYRRRRIRSIYSSGQNKEIKRE